MSQKNQISRIFSKFRRFCHRLVQQRRLWSSGYLLLLLRERRCTECVTIMQYFTNNTNRTQIFYGCGTICVESVVTIRNLGAHNYNLCILASVKSRDQERKYRSRGFLINPLNNPPPLFRSHLAAEGGRKFWQCFLLFS